MAGIADLIERKSPKLLAQAGQVLNQMVSEGLCDEPQKQLMLGLGAAFRPAWPRHAQLTEPEARIIPNAGCSRKSSFVSLHWPSRLRKRDCAR